MDRCTTTFAASAFGIAPSNYPGHSYSILFCTGDALAANGVSLALDAASFAAGELPGGGGIRLLATVGVGSVATGYSAATSSSFAQGAGNFANGTLGTTAGALAILDKATVTLGQASKPLAFLPVLSYLSTAFSTYSDLKKTYQAASACVSSGKYD